MLSADIPHYLKYIEKDLIMNDNYNILWMFFKFEKKGLLKSSSQDIVSLTLSVLGNKAQATESPVILKVEIHLSETS